MHYAHIALAIAILLINCQCIYVLANYQPKRAWHWALLAIEVLWSLFIVYGLCVQDPNVAIFWMK